MTWQGSPFEAIRRELSAEPSSNEVAGVRLDLSREDRTGLPEFVLAGSKSSEEVARSLTRIARSNGSALATRCRPDQLSEVPALIEAGLEVSIHVEAAAITARDSKTAPRRTSGKIGILTAGSSDRPAAAEAALVAEELGCEIISAFDVGVAGLHRLVRPLEAMAEAKVHVIIVAAGMD